MAAISPFVLFNLPFVALDKVLKKSLPLELIQLLSVSKKTEEIVKAFLKRRSSKINYKLCVNIVSPYDKLEIDLWLNDKLIVIEKVRIRFITMDNGYSYKQSMILRKFDNVNSFVNVDYGNNIFYVICEDAKITSKNMLRYMCKTFNPIISVQSFGNDLLTFEVLDVLKNENAKPDEVYFSSRFITDNYYQQLLELPIRKLNILSSPSASFQYKESNEPMKFKKLEIHQAKWANHLEQFLHCKNITLNFTNLKNQDLNRFLKRWTVTDCQLEFLEVYMQIDKPNLRKIVEGLSVEPLNKAYTGYRFENFDDGKCFSFQRSNGEKAIIYQYANSIILQNESYRFS